MLTLKLINVEDGIKEYEAIKKIPKIENGFENEDYDVSEEEFINEVIPKRINNSQGIDLLEGRVPDSYFFLWDDDEIVGLFKIRHCLNDFLRDGPGHLGYCILPEYRGKGYAKEGLKLAIDICNDLIEEDEIYLIVRKDNPASLKVQTDNGAYIVSETDEDYLTRIKLNKTKTR